MKTTALVIVVILLAVFAVVSAFMKKEHET